MFGSEHSWEMLLMWQIERERAKSVRDWSERTFLWGRKKQRSNFQYFIVINLWIFFIVAIKTMTIIVRWLDNRYVLVLQWHLKHWQLPTHQCHFSTRHYHLQFHFCNTTIIDKKAHTPISCDWKWESLVSRWNKWSAKIEIMTYKYTHHIYIVSSLSPHKMGHICFLQLLDHVKTHFLSLTLNHLFELKKCQ